MNIVNGYKRPDQLTDGDYIFNPSSKRMEPVKNAYWSDITQNYVVWVGPLGMSMHLYSKGLKVHYQRYYFGENE